MLRPIIAASITAAVVYEPSLAPSVPRDSMPPELRALVDAAASGALWVDGDATPVVHAPDLSPELAQLARWFAAAPAALIGDGIALLERRRRPTSRRALHLEPIGALELWRRELAAGRRTMATADALWRSACAEANAIDCARAGDRRGAEAALERAADALIEHHARVRPAA